MSSPVPLPLPDAAVGGPAPDDGTPFLIRLDLVDGRLELTGSLGRRTVHLFRDGVTALLHSGAERWVIDVAGLTGCDDIGLRAVGATYRRALRHDRRVTLIGAPYPLQAALGRLRLGHHLLAPSDGRPAALARVPA